MEVELFIHGVPNGEGFWGKEEDRNYFGTFYDHSADEVKFLIQSRMSKSKPYCYYNYLVYKTAGAAAPNVVAQDGRDGSYFGISLRLNAYCKDFMNIFRILDTLYHIYVYGDILKMDKSKLKYTCSDFSKVDAKLKAIEAEAIKLIQNGFVSESFASLDGFSTTGSKSVTGNLYEVTADDVLQYMKQYGKVALSPFYPTMREKKMQQQYNSKIASLKQQFETEKSNIEATIPSLKNQMAELKQEISSRDTKMMDLQAELESARSHNQVARLVSTLKVPLAELTKALHAIAPSSDTNANSPSSKLSAFKIAALAVPAVNFILLVCGILGIYKLIESSEKLEAATAHQIVAPAVGNSSQADDSLFSSTPLQEGEQTPTNRKSKDDASVSPFKTSDQKENVSTKKAEKENQ